MKKKFPKPFVTLIALITVFTGVVIGVHATENTDELTTPVFPDGFTQPFTTSATATQTDPIDDMFEATTIRNSTRRTTTTTTWTNSSQIPSVVLTTYPTSYNPTTQPAATTLTSPQTEEASYVSPLGGYGDGWGSITRHYKAEANPYTQGNVPTGLPSTTNNDGYPVCAKCGEDAWWQLNIQTGEMRIYGSGEIYNMEVPLWWESRDYIKKVVISDDITNISFFAFADCSQLTEVVIGNSVETIGAFAFSECTSLESIVIPDSVKSIDSMAFYGCTSLETITMSSNIEHLGRNTFTDSGYYNNSENWENGVLYVGSCLIDTDYSLLYNADYTIKEGTRVIAAGAFMNSGVKSVVITESVVEIGECAFRWTNMETIEIPGGTKTIRKGAFDCCYDLESIHIPASVEVIEEDAFYNCTALSEITVDESNENFVVDENGAIYTSDKSLLIRLPSKKEVETYTLHENTREIADYAFESSQIKNVVLNDGLEKIGLCAFSGCSNLESIIIPDSVSWIENHAFVWCDNLKSVDLGNAHISDEIFDYSNNIEYLTLGAGFSSGYYCLNLTSSLKSVTVSPGNEWYSSDKYGALYNKDKTVLYKYPAAGERTSYEIPCGVQIIDNNAFSGATNLSEITLPASLTSICASAFYECTSIREVYYTGSEEDWEYVYVDSSNFDYIGNSPICLDTEEAPEHPEPSDPSWWDETTTWIYEDTTHNGNYPSSTTTTAPNDEEYGTYGVLTYVISNGEVIITDCDESASGEIVIPNEIEGYPVIQIGKEAFAECFDVTKIFIPASVSSIADSAFRYCFNLSEITVSNENSVYFIDNSALCSDEDIICLPPKSDVTEYRVEDKSVQGLAFAFCKDLEYLYFGENAYLDDDGEWLAFCPNLKAFIVDDGNTQISSDENGALYDASKTSLLHWPSNSVTKDIILPSSVEDIEQFAFVGEYDGILYLNELLTETLGSDYDWAYVLSLYASFKGFAVPESNQYFSVADGVLYDKDKTTIIKYPIGEESDFYEIPQSVIRVFPQAFISSKLSKLPSMLSENVEDYSECFYTPQNLTVHIPSSLAGLMLDESNGSEIIYGLLGAGEFCSDADENTIVSINRTLQELYSSYSEFQIMQPSGFEIKPCENHSNSEQPQLIYFEIGSLPTKTDYFIGDTLDISGLTLVAKYADGSQEIVTEGFRCLVSEFNTIGTKRVTVTYGEYVNWFEVEVISGPIITEVYATDISVLAGDIVSISVNIRNNLGLMGFSLIMEYDKTVMTPVSVTAGEILEGGTLNDSIGGNMSPGKLKVVYTADENVMTDGVLFNVEFKIDEKAYGDYDIKLSYIQNDTFNEEFEDVVLSCVNSTVKVADPAEQDASAKFYIEPMQVNAGEEITVPICVDVYRGGLGFSDITICYNSEIFSYKDCGFPNEYYELQEADDGSGKIVILNNGIGYGEGVQDTVCYLLFTVKDYVEGTEMISVSCNNAFSYDDPTEVFCQNGEITITNPYANEHAIICTDNSVAITNGYVDVPIYIKNNHGIMGFRMNVAYDSSVLEAVSVTKGALLSNGSFDNNIGIVPGNIKVIWNNTGDVNDNGLLYTLRFKVLDNSITELPLSIMYSQADTYNEKWEDVALNIDIGAISIKREYTATFMADGVVVSTQKFTVDTEKLVEPEIPSKAGYVARWENYTLKEENLIIRAKYELPYAVMVAKQTIKVDNVIRLLPSCNFETTRKVWSSSNTSVAVVDNRGNVTAVGEGKCTIKVTCYGEDSLGNEIKASASTKIVVNEKSEATDLKQKFREAFDEFFEVKLHDFLENLKRFMIVLLKYAY